MRATMPMKVMVSAAMTVAAGLALSGPVAAAEEFATCATQDGQGQLVLSVDWPAAELVRTHPDERVVRCAATAQSAELCLTCAPPAHFVARFFVSTCVGGRPPAVMLEVAIDRGLDRTYFTALDPRTGEALETFETCHTAAPATPEALTDMVGWPHATWDDPGPGRFQWQR